MKEDIEEIKQAIDFVVSVIEKIKLTKKPLLGIVLSLGKLKGFKIKEVKSEIKDLTPDERDEIIAYAMNRGFPKSKGIDLINNLESKKKTTIFSIIRTLR